MTRKKALLNLSAEFGMPISVLLEEYALDEVQPGVCMTCGAVTDSCEPDAANNWCEQCDGSSVQSISVLCGVI
jgi:hypothetical protein